MSAMSLTGVKDKLKEIMESQRIARLNWIFYKNLRLYIFQKTVDWNGHKNLQYIHKN